MANLVQICSFGPVRSDSLQRTCSVVGCGVPAVGETRVGGGEDKATSTSSSSLCLIHALKLANDIMQVVAHDLEQKTTEPPAA